MFRRMCVRYGLALSAVFGSAQAMAAACSLDASSSGNATANFGGISITVGRDVPIGAEVYRQNINLSSGTSVNCLVSLVAFSLLKNTSGGTLSGYGPGVYATGVAGIGVKFLDSNNSFLSLPSRVPQSNCTLVSCLFNLQTGLGLTLSFIKIDTVQPGTVVGGGLPSIVSSYGLVNLETPVLSTNLSGSLNIVSQTCQTPDVSVPMGTRRLSDLVSNGSTSWQNFNIALNNCPGFYGTLSLLSGGPLINHNANKISFRLDPLQTAADAPNGILSLTTGGSTSVAQGVGLQVAFANGQTLPLSTFVDSGIQTQTSLASYTIPLQARYVKLAGQTPLAGTANSTATFTLNYQ